jgi:D-beta-D-heptose 7-phosphate kinase/D-beta-D-heptose 1-phosphate adenosyltransferase
MDEQHRLFIMSNIKAINKALICIDKDSSVANTLREIADSIPDTSCELFFFNSGDRSYDNQNEQEINACKEKSITRVFINLPKVYSSSQLKLDFSTNNVK